MNREQLAHVLRAASRIAHDPAILVIGSQAILGSWDEADLPQVVTLSQEADLAFLDDPRAEKSDEVDGAIGELSEFHLTHRYYAQGVEVTTAILPRGWRERVVSFQPLASSPAEAVCLEPHDLVVSKLAAMREKDITFATALMCAGIVAPALLMARADALEAPPVVVKRVRDWVASTATRHGLPL